MIDVHMGSRRGGWPMLGLIPWIFLNKRLPIPGQTWNILIYVYFLSTALDHSAIESRQTLSKFEVWPKVIREVIKLLFLMIIAF